MNLFHEMSSYQLQMELFYPSKWPERKQISWCEITLFIGFITGSRAHFVDAGGPLKVTFDRIPSTKMALFLRPRSSIRQAGAKVMMAKIVWANSFV